MGMYYKAKLIVGLPQDEIELDDEEVLDDMDRASGYYDCDSDATILGVDVASSGDYSAIEVDLELVPAKIEAAKAKFRELTGQEGKLYLSPHGY